MQSLEETAEKVKRLRTELTELLSRFDEAQGLVTGNLLSVECRSALQSVKRMQEHIALEQRVKRTPR